MARADSTIRVNIIGDAKGLSKELGKADKTLGGFGKGLIGAVGIGIAADKALDFLGDALGEADRLGDATTRLELQVDDLAQGLVDTAGGFAKLGLSTQDVLELEAAFGDTAEALQLSDDKMVEFADDAAAVAGAIALLTDMEPDQVIDLIGKAAGGSLKAMKALGISITDDEIAARALADTGKDTADALTEGDLAAAAYALVLEDLKPRLDAVAEGSVDVEGRQAELQARWETLTGRIGEGVEGPLADFLAWVLAGIDGLERMDEFLGIVEQGFRDALGPLADFADGLRTILDLLARIGARGMLPNVGRTPGGGLRGGGGGGTGVTLQVVPRDSTDTERAVVSALREYEQRNGRTVL